MTRHNLNPGTLISPLPAVLVTVGDMENANILTIAWTGILNSKPPMTYISVRPTRHSHKMLQENGEFVINIPSAKMVRSVDYCGIFTGSKVNKFEKCHFSKKESALVSPPTIAECPLSLECRVTEVLHLGSHDCFVAEIINVSANETILDSDGRLCLDRADLMAYCHGDYYKLGEKIGKFGFSATKKKGKGAKRGVLSTSTNSNSKKDKSEREYEKKNAREVKQKTGGDNGTK